MLALALGLRSFSCGSGDARRTVLRKGGAFRCPDCAASFWDWSDCLAHCTEHRHGGARKRLQQRCAAPSRDRTRTAATAASGRGAHAERMLSEPYMLPGPARDTSRAAGSSARVVHAAAAAGAHKFPEV